MNQGRMVFAQLFDGVPWDVFQRAVARYRGDYRRRQLSCRDQFLAMCFAHLTRRVSLRDVVTCLEACPQHLYHLGFRGEVHRSTLAEANETCDWRIFADFTQHLIGQAQAECAGDPKLPALGETRVFAIDATVVDLALSLYPWAQFRRHKSAVKLHTVYDLQTHLPAFVEMTSAKQHEVRFLDRLVPLPGALYVMDRGYWDFGRLYHLHQQQAFFLVRAKRVNRFTRSASHVVDRATGLRSDQLGHPSNPGPHAAYPVALRRIHYVDLETAHHYYWYTNHLELPALVMAHVYHRRWDIELFFRWIKQHLCISRLFGQTANAVQIQVWCAMAVFVLVALWRQRLRLAAEPYQIQQILSVMPFAKVPLAEVLTKQAFTMPELPTANQLELFDL